MASEARPGSGRANDVELARALLPVLLERIEGTTRRLERIEARVKLAEAGLAGEATDPGEALGVEAGEADELGWLLGWIAGGLGAELLLERHEPRALTLALELVDAALGRADPGRLAQEVPRVSREGGWRLAWAVAGLTWRARTGSSAPAPLELRAGSAGDDAALSCATPPSPALCARGAELARELPGTRFEQRADGWSWSFPASWLEAKG